MKCLKIVVCIFLFSGSSKPLLANDLTLLVNQEIAKADSLKFDYSYKKALKVLAELLPKITVTETAQDTLLADIYYKQAALYFFSRKYELALEKVELAIELQQKYFPTIHSKTATSTYLVGLIHQRENDLLSAKAFYKKAIEQTPKKENTRFYRHRRLGKLYADSSQDTLAITHFEEAIKGFGVDSVEYLMLKYWLATSFGKTKQVAKTKAYFLAARKGCERQIARMPDEKKYVDVLHNLGYEEAAFYAAIGENRKAIELYQQLLIVRKAFFSLDRENYIYFNGILKSHIYFDYTEIYTRKGKSIKDHYSFAPPSDEGDILYCSCNGGLASIYEKIANLYLLLDNEEKAFVSFQKAIKILVPDFKPSNINELPSIKNSLIDNKQLLVKLLFSLAKAQQKKYDSKKDIKDLERAITTYQAIDTLVTIIRQSYRVADARYEIIEETKAIFENAIKTALTLFQLTQQEHYLEQSYQFSAKNKAIVLLDGLQNENAKITAGIPAEILAKEKELKKSYNNLEAKLIKNRKETVQQKKDEAALFQLKNQYTQLIKQLEKDYPDYYELKYAFTKPLKIAAIQEQLPDTTLLLEYFLGEEELYIFSIGKSTFQHTIIPLSIGFRDSCTQYLTLLDSGINMPKDRYTRLAYQLYQTLLEPPLRQIQEPIKRLILIPDDVLIPLSFATFLTKPVSRWLGRKNSYVLHDYAVSYAYANQLLFDKAATQKVAEAVDAFGGFGIEYHDANTFIQKENKITNPVLNRSIGALPNSGEEVLRIHQLIYGFSWIPLNVMKAIPLLRKSIWINEEATKENFIKHAKGYKILHLAMHGLLANDNPLNSALLFSPSASKANNSLKAAELYGMKLNAEMVVLGACDTGRGKINKGEGIRSLARVFTYIGCPSLVASLWKASDEATKKIMLSFMST